MHRSAYYTWLAGRAARLALLRAEELLAAEIALIHAASRGAYGAPRVHAELRRRGLARAQEFTWAASAEAHLACYRRAAETGASQQSAV